MTKQKLYQPPRRNEVLVPFFIVTKTTTKKLYQPPRQNEVLVPFFIVTKTTTQKLYQPPRQMRLVPKIGSNQYSGKTKQQGIGSKQCGGKLVPTNAVGNILSEIILTNMAGV